MVTVLSSSPFSLSSSSTGCSVASSHAAALTVVATWRRKLRCTELPPRNHSAGSHGSKASSVPTSGRLSSAHCCSSFALPSSPPHSSPPVRSRRTTSRRSRRAAAANPLGTAVGGGGSSQPGGAARGGASSCRCGSSGACVSVGARTTKKGRRRSRARRTIRSASCAIHSGSCAHAVSASFPKYTSATNSNPECFFSAARAHACQWSAVGAQTGDRPPPTSVLEAAACANEALGPLTSGRHSAGCSARPMWYLPTKPAR